MPKRFTKYQELWLDTSEAATLFELEELLGRPIPDISHQSMSSFGFTSENFHVRELRLFVSYFDESSMLDYLPKSIINLEYLHTLDVSHNKLSELPKGISKLNELENFYLDYNNFKEFPPEICSLDNLQQLNFDENLLTKIPENIANLSNLQSLQLAGNKLTKFPVELSGLQSLRRLVLNRNLINHLDYITLLDFSRLYVLDLRSNPIPDKHIDKAKAFLRLNQIRRNKFYLKGKLNDYEDPYSLKNVIKRLKSDPYYDISPGQDRVEVAKQIINKYSRRI